MTSFILFFSNNYVIWANRKLKELNIENKMIAVPRHLSSSCGYCLEIKNEDKAVAQKILKEFSIEYEEIIS